jgi:O-acetyl-ADP-ribose deacetylase (regulator of RNase III)
MRIILTAVDKELADAWRRFCGDMDSVEIHHGSIFDVHCDALVSPANSFGFMDGGIDALYSQRLGWQVQGRLQEMIRTRHHGELLVGAAEVVHTDSASFPFLIAAPTMRVPMVLRESVNPYLAARAVLRAFREDPAVTAEAAAGTTTVRFTITTRSSSGSRRGVARKRRERRTLESDMPIAVSTSSMTKEQ